MEIPEPKKQLVVSDIPPLKDPNAYPYQIHHELHEREQQHKRARRSSRTFSSTSSSGVSKNSRPSLARSLTDRASRPSFAASVSGDLGEWRFHMWHRFRGCIHHLYQRNILGTVRLSNFCSHMSLFLGAITRGLSTTHLPSHSFSQRSSRPSSPSKSQRRRSVQDPPRRKEITLEVDEHGRAFTATKWVRESSKRSQQVVLEDSDSGTSSPTKRPSLLPSAIENGRKSSPSQLGEAPRFDAQSAIASMSRGQQSGAPMPSGNVPVSGADSAPFDPPPEQLHRISPGDPIHARDFHEQIRCVCGRTQPGGLMAKW